MLIWPNILFKELEHNNEDELENSPRANSKLVLARMENGNLWNLDMY